MKFNSSHINRQVIHKIVRASRIVMKRGGGVEHIRNSKGHAYLAVRMRKTYTGKRGFEVTDKQGNNVRSLLCFKHLEKCGIDQYNNIGVYLRKCILWDHQYKLGNEH